jgi:hypothetical protein
MFDIQLFGRVEVRTRGIRLVGTDFGGDRPRHLLALIALRGELSTSELAGILNTGRNDVETDMSVLRDKLEPGVSSKDSVVVGRRGRWSLNPDRVRVDVARFDELMAAAGFVANRPLLEDEHEPWAAEARAEYRAKLMTARPVDAVH